MNRCYLALVIAACGGAPKPSDETRPTNALAVDVDPDACTCARLSAPLQIPSAELPRWKQAASEVDVLLAEIAAAFEAPMPSHCPVPLDDRIREVLATHAHAFQEYRALNAASCDHFGRWQLERPGSERLAEQIATIVDRPVRHDVELEGRPSTFDRLPRSCRDLTSEVRLALGSLTISRTCI